MSILGLNSVLFRGKFCSVDNQFSILDLFGQIYVWDPSIKKYRLPILYFSVMLIYLSRQWCQNLCGLTFTWFLKQLLKMFKFRLLELIKGLCSVKSKAEFFMVSSIRQEVRKLTAIFSIDKCRFSLFVVWKYLVKHRWTWPNFPVSEISIVSLGWHYRRSLC